MPINTRNLLDASCPGLDTWLMPDTNQIISSWIKGNFATVAVRASHHPLVKSMYKKVGLLVSTHSKPSGRQPVLLQEQVEKYFGDKDILIVPGKRGDL